MPTKETENESPTKRVQQKLRHNVVLPTVQQEGGRGLRREMWRWQKGQPMKKKKPGRG